MPDLNTFNFRAKLKTFAALTLRLPTATTAELASLTAAINTTDKYAAKPVVNTTTHKIVHAADATAGGVWYDAAGATAHTPA